MFLTLLNLFWIFFKIGLFTFGGGYAMIPLIESELVGGGYITSDLLYDFIGIAESTPGPVAINMATFIGMNQVGLLGAFAATLGVVLPSFLIILLIATFGSKFLKSNFVTNTFVGLTPAVIGLIFSVAITLIVRAILPNISFDTFIFDFSVFNYRGLIVLVIVVIYSFFFKKVSPIKIILLSAILGMIVYSIL
jgi:chromate transporter